MGHLNTPLAIFDFYLINVQFVIINSILAISSLHVFFNIQHMDIIFITDMVMVSAIYIYIQINVNIYSNMC